MKREIDNLEVRCEFCNQGCDWTGQFQKYQQHIQGCEFQTLHDVKPFTCPGSPTNSLNGQPPESAIQCSNCSAFIRSCEFAVHQERCLILSQGRQCPLLTLGCPNECYMDRSELSKHLQECQCDHLALLANCIQHLMQKVENVTLTTGPTLHSTMDTGMNTQRIPGPHALFENRSHPPLQNVITSSIYKPEEMLRAKDTKIDLLRTKIAKLEKILHLKNAKLEDCDFQLSLIKYSASSHDGSMIWKISQFSQRKADAQNGTYTSIFSLPFYSGQYGYKMCLRLYIMGDGIGKGTHLSLFFVVMHGEFDNILQWPFTHKITFKFINQAGGRDIVDTFQPDPMSSSFQKPKSDMNIASGCPRFVSHTELERGGFIVDDTIFVKCIVDTSTIQHP